MAQRMNDDILGIRDRKSARAVREIFNGLGLPVPEEGEYRKRSCGMGALIFVPKYGFVIRVIPANKVLNIQSPHFIKPLFNKAAKDYRFIIDPGYDQLSITFDDARRFEKALETEHLTCSDATPFNIARVPDCDHLVLVDLDPRFTSRSHIPLSVMIAKTFRKFLGIEGKSLQTPEFDPQISQYEPLRNILERAWPENAPEPDPEGIRAFKTACQEFMGDGKLCADWIHSERYEPFWFEYPMHFSILQDSIRKYADRVNEYENLLEITSDSRVLSSPTLA